MVVANNDAFIEWVEQQIAQKAKLGKRCWSMNQVRFPYENDPINFKNYFSQDYNVTMNQKRGVYDILIQWY